MLPLRCLCLLAAIAVLAPKRAIGDLISVSQPAGQNILENNGGKFSFTVTNVSVGAVVISDLGISSVFSTNGEAADDTFPSTGGPAVANNQCGGITLPNRNDTCAFDVTFDTVDVSGTNDADFGAFNITTFVLARNQAATVVQNAKTTVILNILDPGVAAPVPEPTTPMALATGIVILAVRKGRTTGRWLAVCCRDIVNVQIRLLFHFM